jgi:hypothetical protein
VYDPGEYNDRLLLGLKGTMSEAELHLIKQRMQAGRVNKARRGELAMALPIGYWRRPSGEVVLDPDEQVQAVVKLIFAKFTELGSIQGVTRYLVEHGIAVGKRLHSGPDKDTVVWIRPARATLTCMLNSPVYAGIYAYGRRRVDAGRQLTGRPSTGRRCKDPGEWIAMIEDALPAYISKQQYQQNLARLTANQPHADTPGAVRYGPALLAGLLRCGRCQRRMTVSYHVDAGKPRISYNCGGARAEYGGPVCQRMSGHSIDQAVTAAVLQALTPAAVAVSLHAIAQVHTDRQRLDQLWKLRLERAQISVDRARRCYQAVEPENRLVARQLEAGWEQALHEQRALVEEHDRFQHATPATLTPAQQQAITAAAADLPRTWHAATTTDADRKQILRSVLDEITVNTRGRTELVDLTWPGPGAIPPRSPPAARCNGWKTSPTTRNWPRGSVSSPMPASPPKPSSSTCTTTVSATAEATGTSAGAPSSRSCSEQDTPSTAVINPAGSTPTRPHTITSGGCQTWPPNSVSPSAPSTAGASKDDWPAGRRPTHPAAGSCTPTRRNSPNCAPTSTASAAAPPASIPASPTLIDDTQAQSA